VKQLYDKDDNKNIIEMKKIVMKQKVPDKKPPKQSNANSNKKDTKDKDQSTQNGLLDIRKVDLTKNPD